MSILNIRQAILKRMSIMGQKLLLPEILRDLEELSTLPDASPFSDKEYTIVRQMIIDTPYYGSGSIFEAAEFFRAIHTLSGSAVIRLLRSKVAYALMARCRTSPDISTLSKSLENLLCLYL